MTDFKLTIDTTYLCPGTCRKKAPRARLAAIAALALTGLSAASETASAATIGMTITGTFNAGSVDSDGYMTGVAGANISGETFTYTLSYNPAVMNNVIANSTYSYLQQNNNPSAAQETLTVGTYSVSMPSAATASFSSSTNGTTNYLGFHIHDDSITQYQGVTLSLASTTAYSGTQTLTQASLDQYLAGVINNFVNTSFYFDQDWGANQANYVTSTSAQGADQVPEPASLALLGTAVTGIAGLRRRRAKAL